MKLALLFLFVVSTRVIAEDVSPVNVDVDLTAAVEGKPVSKSFAGFSREWRRFPFPESRAMNEVHPKYLQLLRNLAAFNDEGFSIRIGGASADGIKEVPDADRWKQIAQVYEATRTPLILTINLAKGDVELCKAWVRAAKANLPPQAIKGFELGNEPDGWFGRHRPKDYKWETYFDEFAAMRAALVPSEIPSVIGPAWAHGLPPDIAEVMLKKNPGALSMFTGHAYCFAPTVGPKPEKLLIEEAVQKTVKFLTPGIEAAHQAGLPFRLAETGSAWGGGVEGFSDSFGSALWILDFCLSLAHSGLDGVNFHGGGKGHYSAIQDDSDDKKGITRSITVKPTYYGLLVFAEAVAHNAKLSTLPAPEKVKLWSLQDDKGQRRLAVINKDLVKPVMLTLLTGGRSVVVKRLEARSLSASDGVRYAGQTFDDSTDGRPVGDVLQERLTGDSTIRFMVKPVSAALVIVE